MMPSGPNGTDPVLRQLKETLSTAFHAAFSPLALASPDYVAAALYTPSGGGHPTVDVLSSFETVNAGADKQAFAQNHVLDKKIFKAGTSIGTALEADKDLDFYRSGYRADHLCLNFRVEGARNTPNIIQLVFQHPDFFAGDNPHKTYKNIKDNIADIFKRSAIHRPLKALNKHMKHHGAGQAADDYSRRRDMFLLFSDISGFTGIRQELGRDRAQSYVQGIRDAFSVIAQSYGGDLYRSEGDGFWMTLPVTDFDPGSQKQFMSARVLPAVKELADTYTEIKTKQNKSSCRWSRLKTAVVHDRLTASVVDSRYQTVDLDGDGFIIARDLSAAGPRSLDIVLVDDDTASLLPPDQKQDLFDLKAAPGRLGRGKGLILKP